MVWFLLWTVLVLGAAGVFFLLGRDLWRKARALTRELGEASDRLSALSDRLAELEQAREDAAPAVRRPDVAPPRRAVSGDVRSHRSSPRPQR